VVVAGARYEVQKRNLGRESEVVRVRLAARGRVLVVAGGPDCRG